MFSSPQNSQETKASHSLPSRLYLQSFDPCGVVATMADIEDDLLKEKNPPPLDEDDIALLKTYVSRTFAVMRSLL